MAVRFDTGVVLPAVRAPKTAELIAARLRRQIVRGELRPGSRLPPEAELQEQFAVSRARHCGRRSGSSRPSRC